MKWKIIFAQEINYNLTDVLQEVFNSIEPYSEKYNWSILDFEAVGDLGNDNSVLDIENAVQNSCKGLILTLDEIRDKIIKLDQVINLIIAATQRNNDFIKFKSEEDYHNYYPFLIDILDGGELTIISDIKDVVIDLIHKFKNSILIEKAQ